MRIILIALLFASTQAIAYVYCESTITGKKTWWSGWECPKHWIKAEK